MELDLENPLPTSLFQQNGGEDDDEKTVMALLFNNEPHHMPSNAYPQRLQVVIYDDDGLLSFRQETVSLILRFCHNSDAFLSYLAINYLDRFLSASTPITEEKQPWVLRLVAVTCVSLALKMRKTEFSVSDIQDECGFMFDVQTVHRMELLVLGALKWRMRAITPFSFITFFISMFKFKDQPSRQALKARAVEIILKAQHEIKLLEFEPSLISASALLSASHELFPLQFLSFRNSITDCSHVNKENLQKCYNVMQEMVVMDGYESVLDMISSSSTPVNVLDLPSWSMSSSDNEQHTETSCGANASAAAAAVSVRLEKNGQKRRKIGGWLQKS